jgi:hypothetical protein
MATDLTTARSCGFNTYFPSPVHNIEVMLLLLMLWTPDLQQATDGNDGPDRQDRASLPEVR